MEGRVLATASKSNTFLKKVVVGVLVNNRNQLLCSVSVFGALSVQDRERSNQFFYSLVCCNRYTKRTVVACGKENCKIKWLSAKSGWGRSEKRSNQESLEDPRKFSNHILQITD